MKLRITLIGFGLFAGLILAAALVLRHQPPSPPHPTEQTFRVNGIIRSIEDDGKTLVVEHEDIPGYMPSMIMPFTVKNSPISPQLKPGERVRFTLIVTHDDSWITQVERRDDAGQPPGKLAVSLSTNAAVADPACLQTGDKVPDFALTDQNGKPFRLQDYHGKAVLLTFVYTRCPLPNYCPLMSRNFADLQRRLKKDWPARFQLLTISFDPAHDTPEVLKQYAQAFTHDETNWTFASGTVSAIRQLASEFGLVYLPEAGTFTHDLRTALIRPDGRLEHIWRSNVWTPYEVERRVDEVLAAEAKPAALVSTSGGASIRD